MSKSYSNFDTANQVAPQYSIYSQNHRQDGRKRSAHVPHLQNSTESNLKYYIPHYSENYSDKKQMTNYSLYKPTSEMEEKLIQFEKIKKNRFKKVGKKKPKTSINIEYPEKGNQSYSRKESDYEKFSEKDSYQNMQNKYQSQNPLASYKSVTSQQTSFQRIKSTSSNSKNMFKELRNKEFSQMNVKEMKLIFSDRKSVV